MTPSTDSGPGPGVCENVLKSDKDQWANRPDKEDFRGFLRAAHTGNDATRDVDKIAAFVQTNLSQTCRRFLWSLLV